jgi:hypothetical protein
VPNVSIATLGAFSVALLAAVAALVLSIRAMAVRGDGAKRAAVWSVMASNAATLIATFVALAEARAEIDVFSSAIVSSDVGSRTNDLAEGISGLINEVGSVGMLWLPLLIVCTAALIMTQRSVLGRVAATGGLGIWIAACGFYLAVTVVRICANVVGAFQTIAAADPVDKPPVLAEALQTAFGTFDSVAWTTIATAGAGTLALAAVVAREWRRGPRPHLASVLLLSMSIVGALAMVWIAWPLLEEAWAEPLPVPKAGSLVATDESLQLPSGPGPDPVRRAPVLEVRPTGTVIEGFPVSHPGELTIKLGEMRKVYRMMYPEEPFLGRYLVAAARDVDFARVLSLVSAATPTGYAYPTLVLDESFTLRRPMLGQLRVPRTSGVEFGTGSFPADALRVRPEDDLPPLPRAVIVVVPPGSTVGGLAPRLAEARAGGRDVFIELESGNDDAVDPGRP